MNKRFYCLPRQNFKAKQKVVILHQLEHALRDHRKDSSLAPLEHSAKLWFSLQCDWTNHPKVTTAATWNKSGYLRAGDQRAANDSWIWLPGAPLCCSYVCYEGERWGVQPPWAISVTFSTLFSARGENKNKTKRKWKMGQFLFSIAAHVFPGQNHNSWGMFSQ